MSPSALTAAGSALPAAVGADGVVAGAPEVGVAMAMPRQKPTAAKRKPDIPRPPGDCGQRADANASEEGRYQGNLGDGLAFHPTERAGLKLASRTRVSAARFRLVAEPQSAGCGVTS